MFRYAEYVREALDALWRNRTRSLLTILGMVIGTASVIAVFGISRASASGIASTITSFGEPAAFVNVDYSQTYPQRAQIQYRDVASIAAQTQGLIANIQPYYSSNMRVRAGNVSGDESVNSAGAYAPADKVPMQSGRRVSADDLASAAHVTVITADIAKKYFPGGEALGNTISIGGSRFVVVGVYSPLSGNLFNSLSGSGTLFIPYTTFRQMQPGPVDGLLVYHGDGATATQALDAVKRVLQHIHGPQAQYFTQDSASAIGTFQGVLNAIAAGLSAIGGVALVVAGIGVMNIMLVSVVERTREIGIRKSIGASRGDITLQFLLEAIILSSFGGGLGLLIGLLVTIGAASYVSTQLGAAIVPYLLLVSLAIVFSIGIGVLFGMYPAMRAARMDPIEALRS